MMSKLNGSKVLSILKTSIYSISQSAAEQVAETVNTLHERISLLRHNGSLTEETLRRYYGQKRYEAVAESNALEGSTLDVGETRLAVERGVTLTDHDPAYIRDAIALHAAFVRIEEMAQNHSAVTDITAVKELHALILAGHPHAGSFRSERVVISGARHRPPKTWAAVMTEMEHWEHWSAAAFEAPAIIRAAILHAWLAHIHPFSDGNGRTARAVSTLEMVRNGYPPAIIRRTQERPRYIAALSESDEGGDIAAFLDLFFDRAEAALVGLENAAREKEGYQAGAAKFRQAQERRVVIWNTSVKLLYEVIIDKLTVMLEEVSGAKLTSNLIVDGLAFDDYLALCHGSPISKSWAFEIHVDLPGLNRVRRLAWVGYRSFELRHSAGDPDLYVPSLFWSKPNPDGYPKWIRAEHDAPQAQEMSITPAQGDFWNVFTVDNRYRSMTLVELAQFVAEGFINLLND